METGGFAVAAFIVIIVFVLYIIPTLVALGRRKTNFASICALNLFLGWSLIGWVIALVWALAVDREKLS